MAQSGLEITVYEGHLPKRTATVNPDRVMAYAIDVLNLYDALPLGDSEYVNRYVDHFHKVDYATKAEVYNYLIRTSEVYRKTGVRFKSTRYRRAAIYFRKEFMPELTEKLARFTVHDGKKPK